MNKAFSVLLAILLMASCKQKEDKQRWPYELYWQVIKGMDQESYYLPVTIKQIEVDTAKVLTYLTHFDTVTYSINTQNRQNATLTRNGHQMLFRPVQKHVIVVNGKEFIVNQFSTADGTIDAGSEHYWNEQLGFFFVRATHWSNFWIMQFADEDKNVEVWQIVKELHPNIRTSLKLSNIKDGEEHLRQERLQVVK